MDELSRFRGQTDLRVLDGRALVARVNGLRGDLDVGHNVSELEVLQEDMMDYFADVLARQRFSRLFFDWMAHGLEQVLAVVPRTARAYNDIKRATAILDVLARPISDHTREQMALNSSERDRAEVGGIDGYIAYAAGIADPRKAEEYFVTAEIYKNVSRGA